MQHEKSLLPTSRSRQIQPTDGSISTTTKLFRAFQSGPPEAREELFDHLHQLVHSWSVVHRVSRDPADAADMAQDIMERVWQLFADYDRERPLRRWVFGIANKVRLERLRKLIKHRRRSGAVVPSGIIARGPQPSGAVRRSVLVEKVTALLQAQALTERDRLLLIAIIEDRPRSEMAEELRLKQNTVNVYVKRLRARLDEAGLAELIRNE